MNNVPLGCRLVLSNCPLAASLGASSTCTAGPITGPRLSGSLHSMHGCLQIRNRGMKTEEIGGQTATVPATPGDSGSLRRGTVRELTGDDPQLCPSSCGQVTSPLQGTFPSCEKNASLRVV